MYIRTTHGIKIIAHPVYLEKQSVPSEDHYVWCYTIRIENLGGEPVKLLNRHWKITNQLGMTEEVIGPGVVGEQPTILPEQAFQYTSGAALKTPSGIMAGSYEMLRLSDGQVLEVEIPAFSLDSPYAVMKLH